MNFLNMEYFLAVAKEQSFSKAASKLRITQQTLSAQIAGLERELGCKLFVRHVPLELTYAGQLFWEYANDFNQKYTAMRSRFQELTNQTSGQIKIGVAHTRGRAIMPAIIEAFHAEFPGYEVQLIESTNETLQKMLLNEEIDLTIAAFLDPVPGIELYPFYQEEVVLILPRPLIQRVYPEDASDITNRLLTGDHSLLQHFPFIWGSPSDVSGSIGRQYLRQMNLLPPVKVQSENVETQLSLCARNVGACFCPLNLAQAFLSDALFTDFLVLHLPEELKYQIHFGVLKQDFQRQIVSKFISIAKRTI